MTEDKANAESFNSFNQKQYFDEVITKNIKKIVKSVEDYNESTTKLTNKVFWITVIYTITTVAGVCVALFK
jgi:hypothetical protein